MRGEGVPVSDRDILSDRLHTAEQRLSVCKQALRRIADARFPKGSALYPVEMDRQFLEIVLLATHTLNSVEAEER